MKKCVIQREKKTAYNKSGAIAKVDMVSAKVNALRLKYNVQQINTLIALAESIPVLTITFSYNK